MVPAPFVFLRPELAESIANGLEGTGLADYRSGLFLAAPRRTGKSTFLTADLVPECQRRGWLPIYVDLWADKEADPADLITRAIAGELTRYESRVRKVLRKTGADKLNFLRTLSFDLTKPVLPEGVTLSDALDLLSTAAGQPIVLIVDEAQHAITTLAGLNAMFALKSARDTLNTVAHPARLRLVFTGSSRDKLAHLVLKKDQPFFGSRVTAFPLLGKEFVEAFTKHYNTSLRTTKQFRSAEVYRAFEMVGHRPELLRSLISEVALDMGAADDLGALLNSGALMHREGIWNEYESSWNGLTNLQRAVLQTMAERYTSKVPFAPFAEETLKLVQQKIDASGEDVRITSVSVQKALDALREKAFVWKPERGGYAFEDDSMAEWIVQRNA